jgi:ribosomal protein S15P/S13E
MPKKISAEKEKKPKKMEISPEEFEKRIQQLAEKGLTSEKIGEALRKEGIHPKEFGKKISVIMGKKYSSPDVINLQNKLNNLIKHIEKNKQDKRAIREKDRIFAQLRKAKQYFNEQ